MELTNEQVAAAFSGHDFEAAFPYLADGIRWNILGDKVVEGKEGVVATCREGGDPGEPTGRTGG